MTKTLANTFAAALVAASTFGASAALASSGDYYIGGARHAVQALNIDQVRTHSVGERAIKQMADTETADRGDYRTMAPNANESL